MTHCPECRNELWPVRHESQDKMICQKCGYVGPVNPVTNRATLTAQPAKPPAAASVRRSKYGNVWTEVDGIKFQSKREAERYKELKLLEAAGEISMLKLQREFRLEIGGELVCTYKSDFDYIDKGVWIIEDAKGVRTKEYKIKKRLMLLCQKITITEV